MKIKGFNQRIFEGTEFLLKKATDSLKKRYEKKRITALKIGLFIVVLFLISSLINLQLIQGVNYRTLAENNRIRIKEIKPVRGIIYDRNRTVLVRNQPGFTLLATTIDLYEHKFPKTAIINTLKDLYTTKTDLNNALQQLQTVSYIPIILKKNITYETGIKLIPIIEDVPGIFLQPTFRREYIYADLLSHILGYTGFVDVDDLSQDKFYSMSDTKGKAGIELVYEKQLRGIKGERRIQINSLGKEGRVLSYKNPQKGQDIFLTIDLETQTQATKILQNRMQEFQVKKGALIVLDPNNGEIIALVSIPSFDNNLFTNNIESDKYHTIIDDPNHPLFNRAIAGTYPPGSTFKLIVGAAALEEGIADEYFTVNSVGGIQVDKWFFPDWLPGGHGRVNITSALAWSVNTYFYTIGGGYEDISGLGLDRIIKYAKMFNLGRRTGIDLPGEAEGFLPTRQWKLSHKGERWYLGDTYHLSIGQGDILVTPLQVALWTGFFANNGILYQPHIVKQKLRILSGVDKSFISSQNIKLIRQGLYDAVQYGSARSLKTLNVKVAGKTGSAQFAANKKPHGWFTGFAPFEDPKVVLTVLMEEGGGAKCAITVARDFFNWYF